MRRIEQADDEADVVADNHGAAAPGRRKSSRVLGAGHELSAVSDMPFANLGLEAAASP